MPLAVITVDTPQAPHGARHQEAAHVARALALASREIQGAAGTVTSGPILDTGAAVIGSWTYTPVATS